MTVGELLESLAGLKPDLMVVLQEDAEGNGYSPLAGAEVGYYVPQSTWSGDVYSQEDIDNGDAEEGGQDVLILWPVN
jgi:hypothetical protein